MLAIKPHTSLDRLRNRIAFFVALGALLGVGRIAPGADQAPAALNPSAAIEALASKNKPPPIVDAKEPPAVPEGFIWDEQDRVWQRIRSLAKNPESNWAALVEHVDDPRYAVTMEFDTSNLYYGNWTVGRACSEIVELNIKTAYHRDIEWGTKQLWISLDVPEFDDEQELKRWCLARRDKPLYEIQAEACRLVIDHLKGDKALPMSDDARKRSLARVEAKEKLLRETKHAVWLESFYTDSARPYRIRPAAGAEVNPFGT